MNGNMQIHTDFKRLEKFARKNPTFFRKAMEKGAIQFLNWANTGSAQEGRKPPIRWGVLRGSASAFVGNKLVSIFPQQIKSGAEETPSPAQSNDIHLPGIYAVWVWNTDYAKKMHEWTGGWGQFTQQDMDAGNKWIERHLRADKNNLMEMIAKAYKKEAGT